MKRNLLCALVLSFVLSLSNPCAHASNYADYGFSDWSDNQVVFLLKQTKGIMVKRNLPMNRDADRSAATPDTISANNQSASFNNSSIIDFSTGYFKKTIQELALPLDFRFAMYDTNLTAESVESNVQKRGRSNNIVAIVDENNSKSPQKRVAVIHGIDNDGEFTDGSDNIGIVKLDTVIYSKDATQVLNVITTVMSVCEQSMVTDQMLNAAVELCKDIIADGNPHTYIQNGVCYELSIDFLGQIQFEVYANDPLDDRNTLNSADHTNALQTGNHLESDTASNDTHSYTTNSVSGNKNVMADSTGSRNALQAAKTYLENSGFSRNGLIAQLEYEGFSNDEAVNAVDSCGADWNSEAVRVAKNYIDYSGFSRRGLINQLMHDGFSYSQAEYGVDKTGADWNEQAARVAKSYLANSSFSRSGLIEQLEHEGFSNSQAIYGVEKNGY